MTTEEKKETPSAEEKVTKKRGCFYYLGLFVFLGFLLVIGTFAWISYSAISNFTDKEPVALSSMATEQEIEEVNSKLANFDNGLNANEEVTLKLSSNELNAIIATNEELKDRIRIEIQDSKVKGKVSWPFDSWFGKRYLNGSAIFKGSLENGILIVTLESLEGKKPLPEWLMGEIRKQNLAKEYYKDPELARGLRKVKKIEVKGDYILITPNLEIEAEENK